MEMIRLLITGAGAPGCLSILNCLKNNGERDIYFVGVDMNPEASCRTAVDAFYVVPPASNDNSFIESILGICKKEKIDIVIPLVTRELEIFSNELDAFSRLGIKVSVMNSKNLKVANNKGLLLNKMKEAGLPTPNYRIIHKSNELYDAVKELDFPNQPFVIKPCFGNGSRGTRIVDPTISRFDLFFNQKPNSMYISFEELVRILEEKESIPEMMVMEYLPGEELSVDVLADCGKTIYISSREGKVLNSIMVSSKITRDDYAISLAEKIVEICNLDGNIDFDLKRNSCGVPVVMEINPRLPAGIAVQAIAGINYPYLRVKQLLNEDLPPCSIKIGTEMQFRNAEVFYDNAGKEIFW